MRFRHAQLRLSRHARGRVYLRQVRLRQDALRRRGPRRLPALQDPSQPSAQRYSFRLLVLFDDDDDDDDDDEKTFFFLSFSLSLSDESVVLLYVSL